jgi:hypothetical protein
LFATNGESELIELITCSLASDFLVFKLGKPKISLTSSTVYASEILLESIDCVIGGTRLNVTGIVTPKYLAILFIKYSCHF